MGACFYRVHIPTVDSTPVEDPALHPVANSMVNVVYHGRSIYRQRVLRWLPLSVHRRGAFLIRRRRRRRRCCRRLVRANNRRDPLPSRPLDAFSEYHETRNTTRSVVCCSQRTCFSSHVPIIASQIACGTCIETYRDLRVLQLFQRTLVSILSRRRRTRGGDNDDSVLATCCVQFRRKAEIACPRIIL